MATRKQLQDEFLTCIICHEVFRDPVTLHCGHTFCSQCVTAYTKTQKQAIAEKSIICPHCRGLTKAPDSTRPVEEWAGQIKTGFFVKGLVEAVVTDKPDDLDALCTSCQEGGEKAIAVVWCCDCGHGLCSGCEGYHRRLPLMKRHEIIHLSEENRYTVQRSRKRFTCSKHPDAVIDMMCEDCDVAVCHRCCILHHRKCESVIPLEESLPKLKSVIENHGRELEDVVKKVTEELAMKRSQVKGVEKEAKEAVVVIDVAGQKIVTEVREQQTHLTEKVEEAKEDALQSLKADIKSREMRLEEAQQRQGLINEAMKSDVLMNYYEMYKICKPSTVTCIEDIAPVTEKKALIHIVLDDHSGEVVSFLKEKAIATLRLSGDKPIPIGSTTKPSLVRKIDTGLTDIWDGLVMTVQDMKIVIVTSVSNKSVTSIYQKQNKQCKSRLVLGGYPYQITQVSTDKCAVAVYQDQKIEFIFVTPELKLDRTVTTRKKYLGLTCLDSMTLAASCKTSEGVDIIDMSGTILRSFGSNVFKNPAYMTCTRDTTILVSDCNDLSLTEITDQGVTKFKYPQTNDKALQLPWGVASTGSEYIFVTDHNANTVVQLTDTGKYVRDVLSAADGLSQPRALFVDDDNLMYVSVDHTTIHVYEFK